MMTLEQTTLNSDNNAASQVPTFDADYWLSTQENKKEFAAIVKYLKTEFENVSVFQLNSSTVEVKMSDAEGVYKFVFDKTFPRQSAQIVCPKEKNEVKLKSVPNWNIEGKKSISEAFIHFL
ncbi:MAG: hypothetical protein L6V80_03170 [Bacteroidales bacterium]|nr:MAG: hypothetical protein L6V80_03170 [Bacteroidales bacterium]